MRRLPAVVAAGLVLAATVVPASSSPAALQTARAVVNIRGSNHVISFGGSISGIGALQQVASVETVTYGPGVAVCSINGVGNPPIPGQCLGEQSGQYWSYWRAGPGASGFSYAGTGAGGTSVTDGSVEGWNFGGGSPPPFSSFCAVAGCAPPPPPPPPPPPTPSPTVAPTPAVGGTSASNGSAKEPDGSKPGQKGAKQPDGDDDKGGEAAGSGSADTTSTTQGDRRTRGGDRTQAAAPISLERDDDGNSPWGVVVAGAAVAGLGAAGMVIRRRRRATPL